VTDGASTSPTGAGSTPTGTSDWVVALTLEDIQVDTADAGTCGQRIPLRRPEIQVG